MTKSATKSDTQIQQEVLRELRWDTRVKPTEVGVAVEDGVVTLTGTVSSYPKKVAAQEAAHRVRGVLDVANDIHVRTSETHAALDVDIVRAIRHALEWHILVDDTRIQTTSANGWITLEGTVSTLWERDEVERMVRDTAGVHGVTNRIQVSPPRVDPKEIRLTIEDALERRADREAERIMVDVDNGKVVLRGVVHSWREKRAILGAVSHAPGVREVEDVLRIDPYV